ncbi:MAG: hypothetical protein WC477_02725 [Patescibacteria group bacterium]
MTGAVGCDNGAQRGQATADPTRSIALVPPRTVADVTAQVPEGVVVVALEVLPLSGHKLSLRLSSPTRDAGVVVGQYVKALKPHVAEAKQLLSSGVSADPDEAAATAREISGLDALLALPVMPETLLVDQVRLRGNAAALDAFSNYFSKPGGGAP